MAEYSADMEKVFAGSRHIADAVRSCKRLPVQFEDSLERYYGWWGQEGGDDQFANVVGQQCVEEQERVLTTLRSITEGLTALIGVVAAQAEHVQKPQVDALDDIVTQGTASEDDAKR
ncbi:hypothetical protein [Streptomyces sp. NBC_01233]|uniref:hypothetical protein n=1 Tax=Streptomyces sp. NBC_01233 TaxID=2903787 RepID=UPI002E10110B|nr:hypothetical protein OG332_07315 [Streptomyces sp. NBC_01233]WSP92940.1 hypothetical protein OG332_33030 [Streptomyces sp. NBC_01233]